MLHRHCDHTPTVHPTARAAENATLIGEVALEQEASVWFGAVLRGDDAPIRIGPRSNIQDNVVAHCDAGLPLTVGRGVTVGHGAILHSCTIEDSCLIGMGAILLNGCVIGRGSLVAAGALVPQNAVIPPDSLALGSPARVIRPLRPAEREEIAFSEGLYVQRAEEELPLAAAPAGEEAP